MGTKAMVAAGLVGVIVGTTVGTGVVGPRMAYDARLENEALRDAHHSMKSHLSLGAMKIHELEREVEETRHLRSKVDTDRIRELEAALAAERNRADAAEAALATAMAAAPEQAEAQARAAEALREAQQALEERKAAQEAVEKEIADWRRILTDTTRPETDRTTALTRLRMAPDGIDESVIAAASRFFRESATPGIRAVILRDLHGTEDDAVKRLFLDALRDDPSAHVRERAAEDIDTWRDDPEVRLALETARDTDASEDVRKQAKETLETERD